MFSRSICCVLCCILITNLLHTQNTEDIYSSAWSRISVNAIIFRKNSLTSDSSYQFVAFYDQGKNLIIGRRNLGGQNWIFKTMPYNGGAEDAHRSISIQVDGAGYLHLAWDHHNHALRYARSIQKVDQIDAEGLSDSKGSPVEILKWKP